MFLMMGKFGAVTELGFHVFKLFSDNYLYYSCDNNGGCTTFYSVAYIPKAQ